MEGEKGGVASVVEQSGEQVRVSLPMLGFPPGFQLRPGERVVVVSERSGAAVRPLVEARVIRVRPDDVQAGRTLTVDGSELEISQAAVIGSSAQARSGVEPAEHVVWIIEGEAEEGPPQVVAIRQSR